MSKFINPLPFKAQKSVFDELEKIVDISALSKEERMKYDESIKVYRDNLAIAGGQRELGRAEGRSEEKRAIARNMKSLAIAPDTIARITGLSAIEIENL